MKIMLVVNEFPPEKIAGTAMATKALAEHLSKQGHQVCVLVTTPCPPEKQSDIVAHDYQLVWFKARPFRGLGWLWRMVQTLQHAKAFQPDVIQGQAVSCGLLAGVVGRILGVPSICYAQGYDVYQASGWQKKTEIRWGCSLPNQCIAVTKNLKEAILDIVDVPVSLMPHAFALPEDIPNRDDARQFYGLTSDESSDESPNKKVVLNVARLEYFKGHDVLLQAWKACVKVYPDAALWIAGSGSMQTQLEDEAMSLNIHKSVRFLGYLPQQAIHTRMQAADVFVLPSRSEPFGIVLLEAMAHGLPVVASDVGGIPEVLPDDGDAWMVSPENIEALASKLLQALASETYPSQRNQEHALGFTWDKQVARFEAVYQALLKDKA